MTTLRYEWLGVSSCESANRWLLDHGMKDEAIIASKFYDMDNNPIYEVFGLEHDNTANFANWSKVPFPEVKADDIWNILWSRINKIEKFEHEYMYIFFDRGIGWERFIMNVIGGQNPEEDINVMFIMFDDPEQAIEFKLLVDPPK